MSGSQRAMLAGAGDDGGRLMADQKQEEPAKTRREPDGRFAKGAPSANPRGRPVGSRHKATLAAEALLDGQVEQLTQACIDKALAGDPTAIRIVMDRIIAPRRERPVKFALPQVRTPADLVAANDALAQAVAAGELAPSEAAALGQLLSGIGKAIELVEIEKRMAAIEAHIERQGS